MFHKDLPGQFMVLHTSINKHVRVNYCIFFYGSATLYSCVYCPIDNNALQICKNKLMATNTFFSLCERGFKLPIDGSNLGWFRRDRPGFNLQYLWTGRLNWIDQSIHQIFCMWVLQTAIAAIFFTSTHGCKNKNCIIYSLLYSGSG